MEGVAILGDLEDCATCPAAETGGGYVGADGVAFLADGGVVLF